MLLKSRNSTWTALTFSRPVFAVLTVITLIGLGVLVHLANVPLKEVPYRAYDSVRRPKPGLDVPPHKGYEGHEIPKLIKLANTEFKALAAQETHTLEDALEAYKKRRGRLPPAGFDEWFHYAKSQGSLVIEPFFDRIYQDLAPFWAVPPHEIRQATSSWHDTISIRDRKLTVEVEKRYRLELWHDMLKRIAHLLPDVDLPFNNMDESRLFVPSNEIDRLMGGAARHQANFSKPIAQQIGGYDFALRDDVSIAELVKESCPENSAIRTGSLTPSSVGVGMQHSLVSNFTAAKSPCLNPEHLDLHGSFIDPISISASQKLFPLFGGSKLPVNNEILVPAPRYWERDEKFSGGIDWYTWDRKKDMSFWRGVASGGHNREQHWRHYQRQRFVTMCNATAVEAVLDARCAEELGGSDLDDLKAADPQTFNISTKLCDMSKGRSLLKWLSTHVHASFNDLICFPDSGSPSFCPSTSDFFHTEASVRMSQMYAHKILPDIDGNSFSGRFRAFLLSGSLPLKSTVYDEWHDSRLVPWAHFVPLSVRLDELYEVLELFLNGAGSSESGRGSGSDLGKHIAETGREWARKVLRREDMVVYMHRLVLEFARLMDDDRDGVRQVRLTTDTEVL